MEVSYRFVVSDLEITKFGKIEGNISKRINFKASVDGIEKDVTLSWLQTLLSHKIKELNKELNRLKSSINLELTNYVKENGYKVVKRYEFDYDSNICVSFTFDIPQIENDDNERLHF